ncbi:MAG: phosphoglucosamine mutase [Bacteroides sp.]|nr:phosphoglucosamine mutase [Bacteroides sp.]MCM1085933.1 phosphoglucosamine mutase [Bacteroides sp.]
MTLIKSISGIRGTIGGKEAENLTPIDIVKFTSAFARFIQEKNAKVKRVRIVVGRDGRISGQMVDHLVQGALMGMGVDVVELVLSTTPTVEMSVRAHKAHGGIIITASHNPMEWNALKLLNEKGEFISAEDGAKVVKMAEKGGFSFAPVDKLGRFLFYDEPDIDRHIQSILDLKLVDVKAIKAAKLSVVVDGVNSTGAVVIPLLLERLGVQTVRAINDESMGNFAHNPEPLPANLKDLAAQVKKHKAHMGIAVDPDVDRLAFVCEDGSMFGEEYTLVAAADYVLQHTKGAVVSNLSSTRALRDVAEGYGCKYVAAPVGEVNVVERMKKAKAVIGGEGNGGVIYPELHYGRDALVGVALVLSAFARKLKADRKFTMTAYRDSFPAYVIAKKRVDLKAGMDADKILAQIKKNHAKEKMNLEDGIRIDFAKTKEWVQLRKSNTEPIVRVYAESATKSKAEALAKRFTDEIAACPGKTARKPAVKRTVKK